MTVLDVRPACFFQFGFRSKTSRWSGVKPVELLVPGQSWVRTGTGWHSGFQPEFLLGPILSSRSERTEADLRKIPEFLQESRKPRHFSGNRPRSINPDPVWEGTQGIRNPRVNWRAFPIPWTAGNGRLPFFRLPLGLTLSGPSFGWLTRVVQANLGGHSLWFR